jgi:hypothetical protein
MTAGRVREQKLFKNISDEMAGVAVPFTNLTEMAWVWGSPEDTKTMYARQCRCAGHLRSALF